MSTAASAPPHDRILDAAGRLYASGGLAALTTDALAAAAATSKRTLYKVFPTLDDVVEAVLLGRLAALEAELAAVRAAPIPFPERLQAFAAATAALPAEFVPGFWTELETNAPAVAARVRAARDALMRRAMVSVLEEGVAWGYVRDDVPVEVLAAFVEAAADGLLRAVSAPNAASASAPSAPSAAAALLAVAPTLLLDALAPQKPR